MLFCPKLIFFQFALADTTELKSLLLITIINQHVIKEILEDSK